MNPLKNDFFFTFFMIKPSCCYQFLQRILFRAILFVNGFYWIKINYHGKSYEQICNKDIGIVVANHSNSLFFFLCKLNVPNIIATENYSERITKFCHSYFYKFVYSKVPPTDRRFE